MMDWIAEKLGYVPAADFDRLYNYAADLHRTHVEFKAEYNAWRKRFNLAEADFHAPRVTVDTAEIIEFPTRGKRG